MCAKSPVVKNVFVASQTLYSTNVHNLFRFCDPLCMNVVNPTNIYFLSVAWSRLHSYRRSSWEKSCINYANAAGYVIYSPFFLLCESKEIINQSHRIDISDIRIELIIILIVAYTINDETRPFRCNPLLR